MPYHDEEYPGQPLWKSVFLFCCKGVIEGIMVILFFWLLVQVLFTKNLEVHLQILLLVGLIVFCLSLVLGCFLCCRDSQISSGKDKVPVASTAAPAEPVSVTITHNPPQSPPTAGSPQLPVREGMDRDTQEYPSTFSSRVSSEGEFTALPCADPAPPASEPNEQATSYFSLRRLSSPLLAASAYKPIHPTRASLPALPKLGLLTKKHKDVQRRRTVTGDGRSYGERSGLTRSGAATSSTREKPIPLALLNYGSNANCTQLITTNPCLHFTMAFYPEQQILKVTVLNVPEMHQRLEDLTVLGSLPPLHPGPTHASVQSGLGPDADSLALLWTVNSAEQLQTCELKVTLSVPGPPSTPGTALGEVVVECRGRDWTPDHAFHIIKELKPI
ncbi:uncharacterized protein syt18b [Cololabis saira]|uniref:uncharacterized protein syt18b n=1 Tax=Cololabis saira TaxID=129043 RepID=UPI002AD2205E|nr:uncharacterized protein syt18b [Cololabis saira]